MVLMNLKDSSIVADGGGIARNVSTYNCLPEMSEENIEAYFYSLRFWFEASRIVNDTSKFNIVLASVP